MARRSRSGSVEDVATDAAARTLLRTVLRLLHREEDDNPIDLGLLQALRQRCRSLDASSSSSLERLLLQEDDERATEKKNDSGYSLLHTAIYRGDVARILFLLRRHSDRFSQRPLDLLYSSDVVDREGLTPAALLARLQRPELAACRQYLQRQITTRSTRLRKNEEGGGRPSRSNSLFEELSDDAAVDEQNEFAVLSRALRQSSLEQPTSATNEDHLHSTSSSSTTTYACEVVTFGRAHHCALGVVASHKPDAARDTHRPQRVAAFDRTQAAVAMASATFHTLIVTADGALFAFGLGKGGRLGTGSERPCATPQRVALPAGPRVIGVAAAENHSLCVTAEGQVYAFGSNRFGQLGISNHNKSGNTTASSSSSSFEDPVRCVPRRVDDLKHVVCVAVAAGTKHSVALSGHGEIYVWGDHSAGQLGTLLTHRSTKVQRVEALWKATPPKVATAIAASDESTMALIAPAAGQRGLAVHSVYYWGNGNHSPCKAQLGKQGAIVIDPIAISCAKYHHVAITSQGHVYTWGLHEDALGTRRRSRSNSWSAAEVSATTAPQLVRGMLPENGGDKVVAISASENHTAAITEDGHLWTWGDTYQQNVLGHEGVRWQPEPKRVPGVHRAVAVAAAKEHTVLLIGTSFPPPPPCTASHGNGLSTVPSLEASTARVIAQHTDLFNVIPILTMAERTQTTALVDYCKKFIRMNLDGVLNVSQKSAMDSYLNEQLRGASLDVPSEDYRDDKVHPFVLDVILAGSERRESFGKDRWCSFDSWLHACSILSQQPRVVSIVKRFQDVEKDESSKSVARKGSIGGDGNPVGKVEELNRPAVANVRKNSFSSERYDDLTSNMDLSTKVLAEAKLIALTKEVRAIRKRLAQISKLEKSPDLSNDEKQKVARRALLEGALLQFERSIETVEAKLTCYIEIEKKDAKDQVVAKAPLDENLEVATTESLSVTTNLLSNSNMLRCAVCEITCPDSKSFELHVNGRRHRNRMSQVAIDETQKAAAAMIEEQHKQLLLQPTNAPHLVENEVVHIALGQASVRGSMRPKYTLPPPPHPVVDVVSATSPSLSKLSLEAIMAEEERKTKQTPKLSTPARGLVLKLPKGCPATLKSPPWEAAKKGAGALPSSSPSLRMSSFQPTSYASPTTDGSTSTPKSVYSLGDFFPSTKPTPVASPHPASTTPVASPHAAWTTPVKASSASLRDIQEEENDFKSRQGCKKNSNSKWFIEKRERAGSLKDIQTEAAREEESRLLVEEQRRIEQQIYDEIAASKKAAVDTMVKKSFPKRKKKCRAKGITKDANETPK